MDELVQAGGVKAFADTASETVGWTETGQAGDQYATTVQSVATPAAPWQILLSSSHSFPIQFGRYEILGPLGEGTMGAVYLARDKQLDRNVALKMAKFANHADRAAIQRFYREARAMAMLRHANLCPVYDLDQSDGTYFLTMAYIEGQTLADKLAAGKPLSPRQVATLIHKLTSALQAAHQADVIHRDLKPANILIDRDNEPVITDFGLASVTGRGSRLTKSGSMIGTPAYMAPEQVTGNLDAIGPASDIYGLGAILYQLLTGRLPFEGSLVSVVKQTIASEPVAPRQIDAAIDPRLEEICLKALAKDPKNRYRSAAEMADAVDRFLADSPVKREFPAEMSAAAAKQRTIVRKQRDRVRVCWRNGAYDEALSVLKMMTQRTEPAAAKYAAWARRQLPQVQAKCAAPIDTPNAEVEPQRPPSLIPLVKRRARTRQPSWTACTVGALAVTTVSLGSLITATLWGEGPASNEGQLAVTPARGYETGEIAAHAANTTEQAAESHSEDERAMAATPSLVRGSDPASDARSSFTFEPVAFPVTHEPRRRRPPRSADQIFRDFGIVLKQNPSFRIWLNCP